MRLPALALSGVEHPPVKRHIITPSLHSLQICSRTMVLLFLRSRCSSAFLFSKAFLVGNRWAGSACCWRFLLLVTFFTRVLAFSDGAALSCIVSAGAWIVWIRWS